VIGGQSGVTKSVPADTVVIGYPALPQGIFKRLHAFLQRLPQLFQRTKDLEQRVERLEREPAREEVR
jgi:UDP-3-O-[3-hydroxymyristoyl] glucosamine N-acyltransferase